MNWIDITKKQPLHGQKIFVYSPDMQAEEWLKEELWPLLIWDDKKKEAHDHILGQLAITHWLPIPKLPIENS